MMNDAESITQMPLEAVINCEYKMPYLNPDLELRTMFMTLDGLKRNIFK